MSLGIDVYGSLIELPEFDISPIEDWGTSVYSEQKWRRTELPDYFDTVEFDKNGNFWLTDQQEKFAKEELRRCKKGFRFLNNGIVTYITGKNYFYLNWWKLEDDVYPDYRDNDRRYFLFLNHWENVLWCLGIFRGKKRREGASSQATANLIYECIFYTNSNCGLISKTRDDSKDTFTDMAAFGYRQLPVFLKPKQLNKEDTVSEFVFANKSSTIKEGVAATINTDTGHRSKLNFRAPVINAYDRGRISRLLADEGGKWPKETPFSQFISIVSKTMVKGAKRVGFCEAPSTVNELTKSGGAEFKICWDNANQFKSKGKPTPNFFVRYFSPAYDGFEGFIDNHGMSVIGEPTLEQYQYLVDKWVGKSGLTEDDIKMGAKAYLLKRREGLTGIQLEEEIRQNPFDEEEMFMYAGFNCEFNAANIQRQIKDLEDNPPFLRQMRIFPEKEIKKSIFPTQKDEVRTIAKVMDDANGGLFIYELPNKLNHFKDRNGYCEPLNEHLYQGGADTTKDLLTINGSKPVLLIMKKSCVVDGVETGLYPVAMWIADTRLDIHFDEVALLLCKLYGCKMNYEIDARADYYRYFNKQNCGAFLTWTPSIARNPAKRGGFKPEPGTRSGDPFQLSTQLQVAKMWVDGTDNEVYNGHIHKCVFITLLKQLLKYDHNNRTPFDQCIALFMALLPLFGEQQAPLKPDAQRKVLPTHKIAMPA